MSVNVNLNIATIKGQYSRKIKAGGNVALEKGKLLEKVVRLYFMEKGIPVSKIVGSTNGVPDLSIAAKQVVISHSTLFLEEMVIECSNLKKGQKYPPWYIKNLITKINSYFTNRKTICIICSYKNIFGAQLSNLANSPKGNIFIIRLGFQITIDNLNKKLYDIVKKKLDNYFP